MIRIDFHFEFQWLFLNLFSPEDCGIPKGGTHREPPLIIKCWTFLFWVTPLQILHLREIKALKRRLQTQSSLGFLVRTKLLEWHFQPVVGRFLGLVCRHWEEATPSESSTLVMCFLPKAHILCRAGLELTEILCLCLSVVVKGICHHAWPWLVLLNVNKVVLLFKLSSKK